VRIIEAFRQVTAVTDALNSSQRYRLLRALGIIYDCRLEPVGAEPDFEPDPPDAVEQSGTEEDVK